MMFGAYRKGVLLFYYFFTVLLRKKQNPLYLCGVYAKRNRTPLTNMDKMKKIYMLLVFLLVNACTFATDLKEDFETGLPTSAPSVETTVTLASGDWKIKGVYAKKDNNSVRATMNSAGSYLITPVLNQPGRVSFIHRASGILLTVAVPTK